MLPPRRWLQLLTPVGLTLALMAAGNAVSAYSASATGLELCRTRAVAASGQQGLAVRSLAFERGLFSQSMKVSFVTGWTDPDAEVTVGITRPVFFLPWRIASEDTRVEPDRIVSL